MNIPPKIYSEKKQTASTILFVDDEAQELKYFTRALHKEFTIKTASSVDEAINILDNHHQEIAVVISDQRMPVKHGLELLQYTHTNYSHIIRMLTTAYCDIDSSINAINQAEVFRYIPKPWNLDELSSSLNQALKRYYANTNNQISINPSATIICEFEEDCEHWLMYALHAYGDINIYKGGLEALACKYSIRIHKDLLEESAIKETSAVIDKILQERFLSDTVLLDMHSQSSKGFGIKALPLN